MKPFNFQICLLNKPGCVKPDMNSYSAVIDGKYNAEYKIIYVY